MHILRRALLVASLVALGACQRKTAAPPAGIPPLPDAGPVPSAPAGHPSLPAGHPSMPPQGHGTGGGEPKATVHGTIGVDPKVKSKIATGDVIFLVARQEQAGGEPGPIIDVKRLTAAEWPQPFEIAAEVFAGKLLITARVDKDADAMTKNAGDLIGTAHAQPGAKGVTITIDTIAK